MTTATLSRSRSRARPRARAANARETFRETSTTAAIDLSIEGARARPGFTSYEAFIEHPSVLERLTSFVASRTRSWGALSPTDLDDILQDIRVSIWRNWSTNFASRNLNTQIAYAIQIARSRVVDRYRSRSRIFDREVPASASLPSERENDLVARVLDTASASASSQDPEALLVERERERELLARILSVCKTAQQRLILLAFFAGRDIDATRAVLADAGCSATERSIYSTRSRLIIRVRTLLATEGAVEQGVLVPVDLRQRKSVTQLCTNAKSYPPSLVDR